MGERLVLRRGGIDLLVRWLKRLWVPVVYTALTLVMTYPAVLHLHGQVLSRGEDTWIFWWNNWWIKRALTEGENVYFTKHLFFPQGVDLTYHSFSWLNTALWLLLEPLFGNILAYNLTVLWVFPLAGWGMHRLVRELTGSESAAFIAGMVYAFVPYRIGQYEHPNLMGTQWLPFYTLYLLQAIRCGRWRHILLASLFLVLTALVGWNLFLYLLIWTAWIGGYAWLSRMGTARRLVSVLIPTLLIGGLVLSPLLIPMLVGRFGTEDTLGHTQQDRMQTDLLAYVVPSRFHPLWGQTVAPIYDQMAEPGEPRQVVYLGYTVMALLGYGLMRKSIRRQTGLWWGGMLLWWLMALGPFLKLNGHIYHNIPLPYYPLSRTYAFHLLKIPDRYNLMLSLPVAVMVGYVVAGVWARLEGIARAGVPTILSVLILFEYLSVPVKMHPLQIRPFYEQLAQEAGEFGIVELPIDFFYAAKQYMLYQSIHGHPIIEGHVSRRPAEATAFLDANPVLSSLYRANEVDPALTDVSRQLQTLQDADLRYIILHKDRVGTDRVEHWQRYFMIDPRFEDGQIAVYATDPLAGRDFILTHELTPGVGIIRVITSTGCLNPGRMLEVDVGWGTTAAPGRDLNVELALVSSRNGISQTEVFPVSPIWPTREWPANAVAWGYYTLRVHPSLPTDTYAVTLALVDPKTGTIQGQPAVVGRLMVSPSPCAFDALPGTVGVNALFGDDLRLLGYQLDHNGDRLSLTLDWRSERRMETDYKIFVHVFDPATGTPVAQDDAMPHRWAYPTTFWGPGEVVEDVIPISLRGVPAGGYGIAVGIYDPATMERLPVVDGAGRPQPDGRLVLPGEMIQVEEPGP